MYLVFFNFLFSNLSTCIILITYYCLVTVLAKHLNLFVNFFFALQEEEGRAKIVFEDHKIKVHGTH